MGSLLDAARTVPRQGQRSSIFYANSQKKSPATSYEKNELNEKRLAENEALPALDSGAPSPALRNRVLALGEERGYPALSLGQYKCQGRTVSAGLFASRGWWEHQVRYMGDSLLSCAIERLQAEGAQ